MGKDNVSAFRELAEKWGRRMVTVPLYLVLCALMICALPILLLIAALFDLARDRRWPLVRAVSFLAFYLCCEAAGIIASFFIWLVWMGRERFLRRNFELQCWWAASLYKGARRLFDLHIEAEGAEVSDDGPVLVFLRHASLADTLFPAVFISNARGIRLKYVLKRELLWDPCIDIVGNRLENRFLRRGPGDSERVGELMDGLSSDEGVIIYPEGTRFRESKRAGALANLRHTLDADLFEKAKAFQYVLPPRPGGTLALLEKNQGADIIFCAHTGLESVVDLRDILHGTLIRREIRVRFWRVDFDAVPKSREERLRWLYDEWAKVDRWIGEQKASLREAGRR
ncbi:MAG: 1-acyl-sn-glycerol-3-phosphate acyltransferase [Acidobacteriota bacterium]